MTATNLWLTRSNHYVWGLFLDDQEAPLKESDSIVSLIGFAEGWLQAKLNLAHTPSLHIAGLEGGRVYIVEE